jgi:ribosomal protein S18 acetylase RimI-like enzyme
MVISANGDQAVAAPLRANAIVLRPAGATDERLLFDVYAGTRADVAALDWSAEQKAAFLAMQHRAQDSHYRSHFPEARFDVIEIDGEAAGRLYVQRSEGEIRILDIALLPRHTGRGIGTMLLRALQAEAESTRKVLVLHVEQYNPARQLYLRLGFVPVAEQGVHIRMQWAAGGHGRGEPSGRTSAAAGTISQLNTAS